MLQAHHPVIQIDVEDSDIRIDGLPRTNARPSSPSVIVAFDSRYGPLKYYSDTFDDWKDNLRAIALGLQHLRAVDRYGITKRGEQYTGWRALPAPGNTQFPDARTAAEFAANIADGVTASLILDDAAIYRSAYRRAAKKTHPDSGGNDGDFKKLQNAKEVLDKYHGLS